MAFEYRFHLPFFLPIRVCIIDCSYYPLLILLVNRTTQTRHNSSLPPSASYHFLVCRPYIIVIYLWIVFFIVFIIFACLNGLFRLRSSEPGIILLPFFQYIRSFNMLSVSVFRSLSSEQWIIGSLAWGRLLSIGHFIGFLRHCFLRSGGQSVFHTNIIFSLAGSSLPGYR